MKRKSYIAIDLKSFYASVECIARNYDPLHTNLVVADESRTDKTICLAVSPALKSFGICSRPRLFQVKQKVDDFNYRRKRQMVGHRLKDYSIDRKEVHANPAIGLDYVIARPRMKYYEEVSAQIYGIYLRYIAPEDVYVYSIDEAFIDVTPYLKVYNCTARELAEKIIDDVYHETGLTATVGIGTNLYLAKVAMDILAKHMTPTKHGVKIAELNGMQYRKLLWNHEPITDFWRVGKGYARRLDKLGIHTMGEIAACSANQLKLNDQYNDELLYRTFGKAAEVLIDHAWGYEPLTIQDIKAYEPKQHCLCVGQLLMKPYTFAQSQVILSEMSDEIALKLAGTHQLAQELNLSIHYDEKTFGLVSNVYEVEIDRFGRKRPHSIRKSVELPHPTNANSVIRKALQQLFDDYVNPRYLIRRITITAEEVIDEMAADDFQEYEQTDLFLQDQPQEKSKDDEQREMDCQNAILTIKDRFGQNAIYKAMDLQEISMTRRRNLQIGGHLA